MPTIPTISTGNLLPLYCQHPHTYTHTTYMHRGRGMKQLKFWKNNDAKLARKATNMACRFLKRANLLLTTATRFFLVWMCLSYIDMRKASAGEQHKIISKKRIILSDSGKINSCAVPTLLGNEIQCTMQRRHVWAALPRHQLKHILWRLSYAVTQQRQTISD